MYQLGGRPFMLRFACHFMCISSHFFFTWNGMLFVLPGGRVGGQHCNHEMRCVQFVSKITHTGPIVTPLLLLYQQSMT